MSPVTLLVFCCIISSSLAASAFGPATVHESQPNMCYAAEAEKYILPGESWQLGGCSMGTCKWSNYSGSPQLIVSYESCGVVAADPPCYITEESSLAYPDCCPEAVCPEEPEDEEDVIVESDDKTTQGVTDKDEKENKTQGAEVESDRENEVVDVSTESKDYYDMDHSDFVGDRFLYWSHQDYDGEDDSENMIHTNDLGIFGVQHSDEEHPSLHGHQSSEFQGRKVSPKFHYVDPNYPKFGYDWIF